MKKKVLLLFCFVSLLSSCDEIYDFFFPPIPTYRPYTPPINSNPETITITHSPQETEVWCWAACSQMVLRYYNRFYSQVDIVTYVFGAPYNTPANDAQLIYALNGLGNMNVNINLGALSFSSLSNTINAGLPLIAAYQGSFIGHVVVIYGFDAYQNLYIHDPAYGSVRVPYANSFSYSGSMFWNRTFVNIRPVTMYNQRGTNVHFSRKDEIATILNIDFE